MSTRGMEVVGTLQIASGQTVSALLSSIISEGQMKVLGSLVHLVVMAPAALTGAVHSEVSDTYPGSVWRDVVDAGGTQVTFGAGEAQPVDLMAFRDFRLVSAGAEGANRDFVVMAQLDLP